MSKTEKDLMDAFAGESQANRKYLAFASMADKEGYQNAAKLFRAAAEAETIHAHSHLKALGGVKSTKENLKAAIAGETYEYTEMYPGMIDSAKSEGNKQAELSFTSANEAEKIHAELYQKAFDNLENKENIDLFLCPVCGYIAENGAPEHCPICNAKASVFVEIK